MGDEEAEAADREVRRSPRVGTEHGEKRAVAFGKKKTSHRFAFSLMCVGLIAEPLKFNSSQDCWLMDRLSRTLKKPCMPLRVGFPHVSKAWGALPDSRPACCARLTVLGFFRGLQALQLCWETMYQVEKTCSSIFMSLESASRCLLLSCELKSTHRALKANSCPGAGSACSLQHNPPSS